MGMTYRATDVQTANIFLDLIRGYGEPPDVRGEDDVVPGAAGREEGDWEADRLRILLEGWVKGTGATLVAQQQSWRTSTDALMALMNRAASPGALVITAPYYGLAAGSKTIQARCVNVVPGPIQAAMTFQRWSFELVAIDPEWV